MSMSVSDLFVYRCIKTCICIASILLIFALDRFVSNSQNYVYSKQKRTEISTQLKTHVIHLVTYPDHDSWKKFRWILIEPYFRSNVG